VPQLLILNGIRYLKYNKIIDYGFSELGLRIWPDKETRDSVTRNRAKGFIAFGIFFNIFAYSFLLALAIYGYQWLVFVIIPLLLITIYFFYWYWHTKEDPLGDFEFQL
jgi:fatty acid desaturase